IYSIAANTGANSRTGSIVIAGQTFNITQAGSSGCTAPTITTEPLNANVPSGGSANFSVIATGGTTPYSYQWQVSTNGGTSWTNINLAGSNPTYSNWNTATISLTGITAANNSYRYRCIISSGTPCTGSFSTSSSALLTVSSVSPGTITINYSGTNTFIPPWQRQGDDYDGQVTVNRTNSNAAWHLEIDILNSSGVFERAIIYPSITSSTQVFNTANNSTANSQLKQYSVEGKIIRYYAVLENTSPLLAVRVEGNFNNNDGRTAIVAKKWDKYNYVYLNDGTDFDFLKIPILWSRDMPKFVRFSRVGKTAYKLKILNALPISLQSKGLDNFLYEGVKGYLEVKSSNSNITSIDLFPGDFKYEIIGSSGAIIDFGYFDLTKIGKIGTSSSDNILVMVGGLLNEMEASAFALKNTATSYFPESDLSYSVIEYCRKYCTSNFSTWYIAQGNGNYITRNGYDLGLALAKIKQLNVSVNEISMICHSKGGLDTRSMLTGFNLSYDNKNSFKYESSAISGLIKKVVFIGTPHRGARLADLANSIGNWLLDIPAVVDLMKIGSNTVDVLNSLQHNNSIKYLNVTGFRLPLTFGDDVVSVNESSNPSL
ncbi:MAG TPA: hypothetical protein V6C58_01670, partial [Allocoleopsis sp.]